MKLDNRDSRDSRGSRDSRVRQSLRGTVYLDRLTPRTRPTHPRLSPSKPSSPSKTSSPCHPSSPSKCASPSPPSVSPTSLATKTSRAIVKKYRKKVRYQQLSHLQQLVPSTAARTDTVSEAEILEQTAAYIHSLEQQLLKRLQEGAGAGAGAGAVARAVEGAGAGAGAGGDNMAQGGVSLAALQAVLHRALGPGIEERVRELGRRDRSRERRLCREHME